MQPAASSWSFEQDDLNAIVRTITRFLGETGARSALLVDRSGQLVTTVGEALPFDPMTFATLTAADFSANDQLARLIGETDFTTLFHQGERESMYVAELDHAIKSLAGKETYVMPVARERDQGCPPTIESCTRPWAQPRAKPLLKMPPGS